jgi:hypothetical protein
MASVALQVAPLEGGHGWTATVLVDGAVVTGPFAVDGERTAEVRDGLCQGLGYNQRQIDTILSEAAAGYETDRGLGLVERAFAPDAHADGPVTVGESVPPPPRAPGLLRRILAAWRRE